MQVIKYYIIMFMHNDYKLSNNSYTQNESIFSLTFPV